MMTRNTHGPLDGMKTNQLPVLGVITGLPSKMEIDLYQSLYRSMFGTNIGTTNPMKISQRGLSFFSLSKPREQTSTSRNA